MRPPPSSDLTGRPCHDIRDQLREVGLRPTRQRVALGWILFAKGDRHVYNTLHQFTEAGLLREVTIGASKTYFDTNNSAHQHFFIEDNSDLVDIPSSNIVAGPMPIPPEDYEIVRIDVVVRLRRKPPSGFGQNSVALAPYRGPTK